MKLTVVIIYVSFCGQIQCDSINHLIGPLYGYINRAIKNVEINTMKLLDLGCKSITFIIQEEMFLDTVPWS